jgi:Bacterial Ig domain
MNEYRRRSRAITKLVALITAGVIVASGLSVVGALISNASPAAPGAASVRAAATPSAPVVSPTSQSIVTGFAEPGSRVIVENAAGKTIGVGSAGADGSFAVVPNPRPKHGDVVTLTSKTADAVSKRTSFTIDMKAPPAPKVDPTDGSVISGRAEAGARISVATAASPAIVSGQATSDGTFSLVPKERPSTGSVLTVTASDVAGNTSPATHVTVKSAVKASTGTAVFSFAWLGANLAQIVLWAALIVALGLLYIGLRLRRQRQKKDDTVSDEIAEDSADQDQAASSREQDPA